MVSILSLRGVDLLDCFISLLFCLSPVQSAEQQDDEETYSEDNL
jgi:hypothetical protein